MTGLIIDSTSTSTSYVTVAIWAPSSLFSDPTDFCSAHQAADPVTSIFFLDNDVTPWAFHGFPILQQALQHLFSFLSCFIILCSYTQVILVVLAIHVFVDGPAENAVGFVAEFTVKFIDFILIDAPPTTVGSLTVEAVL